MKYCKFSEKGFCKIAFFIRCDPFPQYLKVTNLINIFTMVLNTLRNTLNKEIGKILTALRGKEVTISPIFKQCFAHRATFRHKSL